MIKGTNTDCKITDISVVGSTATVTCLFFASNKTKTPVGLNFYLIDADTGDKTLIDNTTYWVDIINSYDTNLLNVSVNGYKETRITIDITKNNTSDMQLNRWYRKCYLILANVEDVYTNALWSSDTLNLVSTPIEIPEIKNITTYNKSSYVQQLNDYINKIYIRYKYKYSSEIDFNYNNTNLKTFVILKSISTGKELERIETTTSENISVETANSYTYNEPLLIEIYLTNLKQEVLRTYSFIYTPFVKKSFGYIKINSSIKKIYRICIKKNVGDDTDE